MKYTSRILTHLAVASALFALATLVLTLSAVPAAATQVKAPFEVRGDDYHGAVLHPKHHLSTAYRQIERSKITGGWTPDAAMIETLEAGVEAFLKKAKPRRSPELHAKIGPYKRQYIGIVTEDGKRRIYANFFCHVRSERWKRDPLMVADGGDCYFQLFFEPATGTYSGLMVNGEA